MVRVVVSGRPRGDQNPVYNMPGVPADQRVGGSEGKGGKGTWAGALKFQGQLWPLNHRVPDGNWATFFWGGDTAGWPRRSPTPPT